MDELNHPQHREAPSSNDTSPIDAPETSHNGQDPGVDRSENRPNVSGGFGNSSEMFPNGSALLPKDSETDPEPFGRNHFLSEKTPNHTLSVREAARLFEEAGAPRTERSILNWCNPNKRGIRRLDCYFDGVNRKYLITPKSVSHVIKEEREKQQFTDFRFQNVSEQQSEAFGNSSESVPNDSEGMRNRSEGFPKGFGKPDERVRNDSANQRRQAKSPRAELSDPVRNSADFGGGERKIVDLEAEVMDLKITNKAKDYFIERLKEQAEKERQDYIEERKLFIHQLTSATQKIGQLETRLLQPGRVSDAQMLENEPGERFQFSHSSKINHVIDDQLPKNL